LHLAEVLLASTTKWDLFLHYLLLLLLFTVGLLRQQHCQLSWQQHQAALTAPLQLQQQLLPQLLPWQQLLLLLAPSSSGRGGSTQQQQQHCVRLKCCGGSVSDLPSPGVCGRPPIKVSLRQQS
jgi:hypothetical protein